MGAEDCVHSSPRHTFQDSEFVALDLITSVVRLTESMMGPKQGNFRLGSSHYYILPTSFNLLISSFACFFFYLADSLSEIYSDISCTSLAVNFTFCMQET